MIYPKFYYFRSHDHCTQINNMTRRIIIYCLFILSIIFFILGITQPFMTFKISLSFLTGGGGGLFGGLLSSATSQMDKTIQYNILQAISNLLKNDQYFVAILIGFFGLLIPIFKSILFLILSLANQDSRRWHNALSIIGKFAMADVFCVGIFIAFLYAKFQDKVLNVSLEKGYYYFVIYCFLSLLASTLTSYKSKATE